MTMTTHEDDTDRALEPFFEAARAAPPPLPAALAARIAADARRMQPVPPRPAGAWWRGRHAPGAARMGWLAPVGGLPGLGGLSLSCLLGLWLGVAPPAALPDLGALALGLDEAATVESAGFGWDIESEEG